jgi:TonB family protein
LHLPAAWHHSKRQDRTVVEEPFATVDLSSLVPESLIVSPDSRRVAFLVRVANKGAVVIDGKQDKSYDNFVALTFSPEGIRDGTVTFSPDSRRIAYVASRAKKSFVVVDDDEGREYDGIVGSRLVWDSGDALHCLAAKGAVLVLVNERLSPAVPETTPTVHGAGPDDIPPRILHEVKPAYTREAEQAGIEGTVLLECVIEVDGAVKRAVVVRSLDQQFGLDEEALRAVRQWRFAAGTRRGKPVPVLVTIEMTFSLRK